MSHSLTPTFTKCCHIHPTPEQNHLEQVPKWPPNSTLAPPINQVLFPEQRGQAHRILSLTCSVWVPSSATYFRQVIYPLCLVSSTAKWGEQLYLLDRAAVRTKWVAHMKDTRLAGAKHSQVSVPFKKIPCYLTNLLIISIRLRIKYKLLTLTSFRSTPPCSYHPVSVLELTGVPAGASAMPSPQPAMLLSHVSPWLCLFTHRLSPFLIVGAPGPPSGHVPCAQTISWLEGRLASQCWVQWTQNSAWFPEVASEQCGWWFASMNEWMS